MDLLKSIACEEIDQNAEELRLLGRRIWKYAEPGGKEEKTVKTLIRFLKKKNFRVTKNLAGLRTAFKAEFGAGESGGKRHPKLAIVCQYDAVEGKGHINGNNLVAEVTVAAALGLQAVVRSSGAKIGRVTLVGCPNSQGGALATLVNRKVFSDVDLALTAIPGPRTEWSPVYLGKKKFRATYKGSDQDLNSGNLGGHPLTAAVLALNNVAGIQQHFGRGWQIQGNVCRGGKKPSEKLTQCEAIVSMRAPSNPEMILMEKRVVPCLEAAATSSGCELDLSLAEKTYHSLVPNTLMSYLLQLNAYHCGVLSTPYKSKYVLEPVDVGNLSHLVPTARPMYFIGTDAEIGTPEFKKALVSRDAHAYTLAMAKTLAMTGTDILQTSVTLARVRAELQEALSQEKEVKFQPFVMNTAQGYVIRTDLPSDTNTGWSRQV